MTFRLGELGDTHVYVHGSFVLAAFVLAVTGYGLHLLVYLGSLLFHEMGHIFAASCMGASISRVEIWPFGAIAKLEHAWQLEPAADALVALSGPLNSGILASVCFFINYGGLVHPGQYPLLMVLMKTNMGLFAINLLPCLPLDGGRFVRSQLAMRLGFVNASRKVALTGIWVGATGVVIGLAGIFTGRTELLLLVGGILIIWGSLEERECTNLKGIMDILKRKERLKDKITIPVQEIMVSEQAYVKDVVSSLKPSRYYVLLVTDANMKVLCKVSETKVLAAFSRGYVNLRIKDLCNGLL